jgi:hypothetical protein
MGSDRDYTDFTQGIWMSDTVFRVFLTDSSLAGDYLSIVRF